MPSFRRTLLKQDLAKKLYPHSISIKSALQQLRREINCCPELKQQLEKFGNTKRHYYNSKQLALILKHFCLTDEDWEAL